MENRRSNKKILTIILVIIFLILVSIIIALLYQNKELIDSSKVCHKEKKVIEKTTTTAQSWEQENILFLGDSITEFYPIDSIFVDLPIVKSGVSGYTTDDILERMESMVYKYNPTKVFLLIGTNDINSEDDKKNETIKKIEEIIEKIREKRKKAKIYLESIYPVNQDISKNTVKYRNNDTIIEINKEIKEYCDKEKITYIDMYKQLANADNNFDDKYTDDGLHPNDLGYARISQVRLKYIYDIK